VTDGVWDNRFKYVDELAIMGAKIQVDGRVAIMKGVRQPGGNVKACESGGVRSSIAGLCAPGHDGARRGAFHRRGYEKSDRKIGRLARYFKRPTPSAPEDELQEVV
jgi:UDP-N-acetylglucosamine 1-carboxyvinyltransferase